jgi:RNA polymerase sigma-70 factor (ECF subfamily)
MTSSDDRMPCCASISDALPDPLQNQDVMDHEQALLGRLRGGDEAACEELVRTHGGRLLSVARRMLRNDEDARDAVQQAFLSAFRALPGFNRQSRIGTWLHRIVVNAALMKLRTRSRHPEESIEALLPRFQDDGHHVETWSDLTQSVDVMMERRETRQRVRAAIDRLPDSYRTVLLLRDIEELDTATTAELLGLSANAVKIKVHRARQALAQLLASEFAPLRS